MNKHYRQHNLAPGAGRSSGYRRHPGPRLGIPLLSPRAPPSAIIRRDPSAAAEHEVGPSFMRSTLPARAVRAASASASWVSEGGVDRATHCAAPDHAVQTRCRLHTRACADKPAAQTVTTELVGWGVLAHAHFKLGCPAGPLEKGGGVAFSKRSLSFLERVRNERDHFYVLLGEFAGLAGGLLRTGRGACAQSPYESCHTRVRAAPVYIQYIYIYIYIYI